MIWALPFPDGGIWGNFPIHLPVTWTASAFAPLPRSLGV